MTDRTEGPGRTEEVEEGPEAAGAEQPTEREREGEAAVGESTPAGAGGDGDLESMRDRYLRLAAEYDNFRKRTERERMESWTRAQAQLVERLLDGLDDLQRVAHFNEESTSVAALLEGVQMVERKLLRVLEGAGLEQVEARGQPFDPAVHEAIMTAPAGSRAEDDTVGEVFQQGYRFKGEMLRPARVQVRKYEG
jgi:molecular chaperone GrpE